MMKYQDLIKKLNILFPIDSPPEKVTKCFATRGDLTDDSECMSVENDFANRNRDSLSSSDCSMLIIDSALITDEAFAYFIPRIARAVTEESGDAFILCNRLRKLKKLNQEQKNAVDKLILICEIIEDEADTNL